MYRIKKIKKGADVTITESHGGTPLHWASAWDNVDLVEKLISKGAEIDKGNRNRGTALHYASRRGCYKVVKLLIEKGADVNIQKTSDRTTPLHLAGENGHDRVYNLLVENGSDENLLNKAGKSPLQLKNEFIRRTAIKIDPAIYDLYVGRYYSEGSSILEIVKKKDRLFIKFSLFLEEIFPESETKFFSITENRQVVFIKDDDNQVKEILYTSERRTARRKKLVVEKSGLHPVLNPHSPY